MTVDAALLSAAVWQPVFHCHLRLHDYLIKLLINLIRRLLRVFQFSNEDAFSVYYSHDLTCLIHNYTLV